MERRIQRQRGSRREQPPAKQNRRTLRYDGLFGGSGWIRTTEVEDNRFTVCPLWPLGNAPICNYHGCQTQEKRMELVDGLEPPTC